MIFYFIFYFFLPSRVVVKWEQWIYLLCTTRRLPRLMTACRLFLFSEHMFLRQTPAAPAASLSFIGVCCVLCRMCVLLDPKLTHKCPCKPSTIFLLFYFILFAVAYRVVKWEQWIYLLCTTRQLPRLTSCMLFFFSEHVFLRRTPSAPAANLSFIGACCVVCRVCVLLDPKLTHTCPCEASTIYWHFGGTRELGQQW